MKKLITAFALALLATITIVAPISATSPNSNKPEQATNVELGRKVTIHEASPGKGGPSSTKGAATGVLGASLASGGQKYALVIGISDYPGTANDLNFADDDADLAAATLLVYGFLPANIKVLKNMAASRAAIYSAIAALQIAAGPNDEVVIFYSGHGAKGNYAADDTQDLAAGVDLNGVDEAIVSHDGNASGSLSYIWDGELRDWFDSFNTNRIVFIFDSCFAGGMTDLAAPGRIICMACQETKLSAEGGH